MTAKPLLIRVAPVVSVLLGLYAASALFLFFTASNDGSVATGDIPRSWARTLCVTYPAGFSLFGLLITPSQAWLATIPSTTVWALLSIPLYWFFYRRPGMRAYYDGLAGAKVALSDGHQRAQQ
ncbi:MAG: hypothetical protein ACRENP_21135 [Longimicrobiales bacterium]